MNSRPRSFAATALGCMVALLLATAALAGSTHARALATGISLPPNEALYIADTAHNRVLEINSAGVETTVPTNNLINPDGVAMDSAGDLYISDYGNNRVVEVTPAGTQVTVPLSGLNNPGGVSVDDLGDLYVVDTGNNRVVELSSTGVESTVASGFPGPPHGVYSEAPSDVYISYFNGDNGAIVDATLTGGTFVLESGLTYPVGLAQDGGGNLYVAAANGVWEYQGPPDNEVPLAVPLTGLQVPAGVDVDGNQDLFVSDLDGNDVVELTPAGTQTTVASGLMYPWAIEVGWVESYAPDNDLAVSVPADMTVNATGPAGGAVTFTATASDADDSAVPAVSCTPASASTFAVGTTTVTCGASDADDVNSPVSGTFTVTVVGAAGQLTQLQQSVTALGPGAAVLDKTLARASKDLQAGASARVCADLTTFEGQVTSQTGHSVPPAVAGQLIASAQQIQAVIGC